MKKMVLLCVVILIAGTTSAQKLKDSQVPVAVKESFAKRFQNVKKVEWSKESATEFEAEFKKEKLEQSANFDQHGNWLGTETEIKKSELPQAVLATITKEFAGYKIEEAERAETSDKGTFYEVELEKGKMNYEVQLSTEGKVIKKEIKKGDGKD